MQQYDTSNLMVHPGNSANPNVIVEVQPEQAGWEYIHFQARKLPSGQAWSFTTGEHELGLVLLGGDLTVGTNRGTWQVAGRKNVFEGLPTALYLPRNTDLTVTANADSEFAVAWVATDQDHAPKLITP